jgi:uroporphyrinogen-III decarboxylase
MPYFLETYLDGISEEEFFHRFALDPVTWTYAVRPDRDRGEYWSTDQEGSGSGSDGERGSSENGSPPDASPPSGSYDPAAGMPGWIVSDDWRIESGELPGPDRATRFHISTPGGTLSMVLRHSPQTDWVVERPIKEKRQIELLQRYAPNPLCDVDAVNRQATALAGQGILRGGVPGFQIYGQPGCWQDAAELLGIERLIMESFDDPLWVKELLEILRDRKLASVASMEGAKLDLIELGGGAASSTVISPHIFAEFVAPYDTELIQEAHRVGQRVVYHTCGGMMPLLEQIADMGPDAMETFTPPALGGDTDLAEAKERIGHRVCMIGGFDQYSHFEGCTPEETRRAVRRCFEAAGGGGGFILAPSDHFFDADVELIAAFAEEARACRYPRAVSSGHRPEA